MQLYFNDLQTDYGVHTLFLSPLYVNISGIAIMYTEIMLLYQANGIKGFFK